MSLRPFRGSGDMLPQKIFIIRIFNLAENNYNYELLRAPFEVSNKMHIQVYEASADPGYKQFSVNSTVKSNWLRITDPGQVFSKERNQCDVNQLLLPCMRDEKNMTADEANCQSSPSKIQYGL